MNVLCHECLKEFDTEKSIKITENIFECPSCEYPNSKGDLGIECNLCDIVGWCDPSTCKHGCHVSLKPKHDRNGDSV